MSVPLIKSVRHRPVDGPEEAWWVFHCPGCEEIHQFDPRWTRSGPKSSPTFSPSLVTKVNVQGDVCHLYVREGRIQFLDDSHHELAGQTVPMLPVDW